MARRLILNVLGVLACCSVAYGEWPAQCDEPPDVPYSYLTATPMITPISPGDTKYVTLCNTSGFLVTWYAKSAVDFIMLPAATGVLGPGECRDVVVTCIPNPGLPPGTYPGTVDVCNIATEATDPPPPEPATWTGYGPDYSTVPDDTGWTFDGLTASTSTTDTNRHALIEWEGDTFSGKMMMTDANGGIGVVWTASANPWQYHRLRQYQWHRTLEYSPFGLGASVEIGGSLQPNVWYEFVVEVTSTTHRFKLWAEGTAEPDWVQLPPLIGGVRISPVGFWTMGPGGKSCSLTSPDPPPPPDNCPDDPNKTEPGVCGCGVPDNDTDGDEVLDCVDACPLDAEKILPGRCGCGVPDYVADVDGDCDVDLEDFAIMQAEWSGPR